MADTISTSRAPVIKDTPLETPATDGLTVERFELEEPSTEEDNVVWPSGHKLWLNMASIFMTQILVGLV
jgi:hypothetical protein